MLSIADADLVRRDRAIPGLAVLLDSHALLTELQAIVPAAKLGDAQITYVKYRPGSSCLVGYRIEVAGSLVELYAEAVHSKVQVKQRTNAVRSTTPGPFGLGPLILPKYSISLAAFPDDNKLRGLKWLSGAETRRQLMRELLPDHPDYWTGSLQALRYWPQRRYVAQLLATTGEMAVLKFYSKSRYQVPRANGQAFAARGPLRLARQLGRLDSHCVLALEWLTGRVLRDALTEPSDFQAPNSIGAALAALHCQTPGSLRRLNAEAERSRLVQVASHIGFLCPRLAEQASDLAGQLSTHLAQEPTTLCPIHNDFHARQVLLEADAVAILDLDEAGWGDPAVDVGNFIAHLELDVLRGEMHRGRVELMSNALIESYCTETGRLLPSVTILHVAARLFRRLPIHFRYHVPNWPELTELMLKRSQTFLRMYVRHGVRRVSDLLAGSV
jgi:streptomycin 6-kinase